MKTNWGIIGCGNVTELKSGPAFRKVDRSDVVAVMRRNAALAEDYARRHRVGKWYSDACELIHDQEVNAVYIATPPGSHAEYAVAAMRAGKPVYIEKPMAASYEECLAIAEVAEQTGMPCFVAYYRRTLPYFLRIKELVDNGEIGAIKDVRINFINPPYPSDLNRDTLTWRVNREIAGAGYFYDLASHQLDFLDYLFGEITEADGIVQNVANLYDVEDTVDARWKFHSGISGSGHWEFAAPVEKRTDEVVIQGAEGTIGFSTFSFSPIVLENRSGRREFIEKNPENIAFYLIKSITDWLNGAGEYPVSDFRSAMRTNWVMDRILGR